MSTAVGHTTTHQIGNATYTITNTPSESNQHLADFELTRTTGRSEKKMIGEITQNPWGGEISFTLRNADTGCVVSYHNAKKWADYVEAISRHIDA